MVGAATFSDEVDGVGVGVGVSVGLGVGSANSSTSQNLSVLDNSITNL